MKILNALIVLLYITNLNVRSLENDKFPPI